MSGAEFQMSGRPSPSKSTACFEKRGRQELRLAERAGPGRFHRLPAGQAVLDHDESGDHLLAEHLLAGRHEGLGAEHLEGVEGDFRRAEAGFAAPDGKHHLARHAVALLDRGQRLGMLSGARSAAGRHRADGLLGKIAAGRAELGLVLLLRRLRLLRRASTRSGSFRLGVTPANAASKVCLRHAVGAWPRPEVVPEPCAELLVDLGGGGGDLRTPTAARLS